MSSSFISRADWQGEVQTMLPSLSRSQAQGLGRISYAVNVLGYCGLTRICGLLAQLENRPLSSVRQKKHHASCENRLGRIA